MATRPDNYKVEVELKEEPNIITARGAARSLASELGFGITDQTRFATAVSELVQNVLCYATSGKCIIEDASDLKGLRAKAVIVDWGPGIPDIARAMEDGYSTGRSLGAGLPGARRLVHEFEIASEPGHTVITIAMVHDKEPTDIN